MKEIFITGTDTGVGKTLVTALLALHFQSRGMDVGVMKPIASGCERVGDELVSEDARWLQQITGIRDEMELINPVRYEEPLAPLTAARRAGETREILPLCRAALQVLSARHELMLVEGVGGLLVPLQQASSEKFPARTLNLFAPQKSHQSTCSQQHATEIQTCADWINESGWPTIIVARRTLGTINHSTLTCAVPLQAPAHFHGLIFCDAAPVEENDIAAQTSPQIIAEMTGLPILGEIPFLSDLSRENLQHIARQFLRWPDEGKLL